MANPTVEKLKNFGLNFGDKIAVALAGALCLFFVFMALTKETIDTTPEDLTNLAKEAQANLNRPQDETAILEKIEQEGMVLENFDEQVALRESTRVDTNDYRLARSFVAPEPGAGLIRDSVTDKLLAPYEVIATAGRGGVPFYSHDEAGNVIPLEEDEDDRNRLARTSAPPGYGTAAPGGLGGTGQEESARAKEMRRRREEDARRREAFGIAGADNITLEEEEPEESASSNLDYEFEVLGQRWVAVVGLLNNKRFREVYSSALKVPYDSPTSHPDYQRVELQRQYYDSMQGEWSDWERIDPDRLEEIMEYLYAEEDESTESKFTPSEVRLDPLVTYLPYLSAGYWTGVHHAQLIPPDKLREMLAEVDVEDEDSPFSGRGMGDMMGMYGMGGPGMPGMGGSGMPGMGMDSMEGMGGMPGYGMGMGGMPGYGPGMGMGGRSQGSGPEHMTEEEIIMVRALDYTVQPDQTYRYRTRVVVANPNYNRDDIAPGVDNESQELAGPWSEPTDPVTVPADVSVFAMSPARPSDPRQDAVNFDVVAWDPDSGQIAVQSFPAAPGQFIGEPRELLVAVEDEEEPQSELINFQSRHLVVDTTGGIRPVQDLALPSTFQVPAVAAVLKPDGSIALHNQSIDSTDEQLVFMRETYRLSIDTEVDDKRNQGNMMGGMMGMYGMGNN